MLALCVVYSTLQGPAAIAEAAQNGLYRGWIGRAVTAIGNGLAAVIVLLLASVTLSRSQAIAAYLFLPLVARVVNAFVLAAPSVGAETVVHEHTRVAIIGVSKVGIWLVACNLAAFVAHGTIVTLVRPTLGAQATGALAAALNVVLLLHGILSIPAVAILPSLGRRDLATSAIASKLRRWLAASVAGAFAVNAAIFIGLRSTVFGRVLGIDLGASHAFPLALAGYSVLLTWEFFWMSACIAGGESKVASKAYLLRVALGVLCVLLGVRYSGIVAIPDYLALGTLGVTAWYLPMVAMRSLGVRPAALFQLPSMFR